MSTAEPYGDPNDPSFHTADRPDHPEDDCTDCGHASDCSTHNEPALPAGPCDCRRRWSKGGFLHGERYPAIAVSGNPESIIPIASWNRGHEKLRPFDGAAMSTPDPTADLLRAFTNPLIDEVIRRQLEHIASLPDAPEGYQWEVVTEWPPLNPLASDSKIQVSWRWVLRPVDGSDQ